MKKEDKEKKTSMSVLYSSYPSTGGFYYIKLLNEIKKSQAISYSLRRKFLPRYHSN